MIVCKKLFLIAFLALSSCQSIPKPPVVEQMGYSVRFKKFRACNSETGVCRNIPRDDPSLEGAQALSPNDFKAMNAWIDQLINMLISKKASMVEVTE